VEAPPAAAVRSLVPLARAASVPRSIEFYGRLGFEVRNSFTPPESREPVWVWLGKGDAHLMLSRASAPVLPEEQAVLFYLYFDDVRATRETLERAGVPVGPIEYPLYAPRGEFRIQDPDGYGLTLT
jgi:catechol 2,3-dioxygenase-like lactoylglutathione lyase family enzyme